MDIQSAALGIGPGKPFAPDVLLVDAEAVGRRASSTNCGVNAKAPCEVYQQALSLAVQRFGKEYWRVTDLHLALADVELHTGSKVLQFRYPGVFYGSEGGEEG